ADTDDNSDAFVRDVVAGTTVLVDRLGPDGPKAVGGAYRPVMSADGRKVLFGTYDKAFAPGLVGAGGDSDEDGSVEVVRDLATGQTRTASAPDGGEPSGHQSYGYAALSADGGCVAFDAYGTGIAPGADGPVSQVFVHVLSGTCGVAAGGG